MSQFNRQWQRWYEEADVSKDRGPVQRGNSSYRTYIIIAVIIALFIIASISKGIYTEWLWFDSTGYSTVYTTVLGTRTLLFFSVAIIFFAFFAGNLLLASRLAPRTKLNSILPRFKIPLIIGAILLSIIFGLIAQRNWLLVLEFLNRQPFGVMDPAFGREISFYVFSVPFMNMVRNTLMGIFVISFIAVTMIYLFSYTLRNVKQELSKKVLAHLGGLATAILALFAWGYWLGIWELVYSKRSVIFGAGYADLHANLPALWILIAVVIIAIAIVFFALLRRKFRLIGYTIAGWVAAVIIFSWIFPGLVQRLQVQPNELALETPYIEYNIESTKNAFALNRIEEQAFPAENMPTQQDIEQNEVAINNIRLWDHRPLKDTYNQIQSIRLYYDFYDVDIDRYTIDGKYQQVMLSARELSAEKLTGQAQTWVNRQLQFTHGYGVALSPVNEISSEGLPVLLIKDIPPVGSFNIEQPQIYFGEKTNNHVIVKTKTEEFDYPMGDENVYGRWEGEGGVNIGSFLRRFVYAWELGDFNILISGEITGESELLYYRNIKERVNHLAPFLKLDDDPYLVIVDGKLFWIQDAYTVSNRYPYSEPYSKDINYIRNSAKVLIDAYTGEATFYIVDSEDALIRTYQSIFPELFVPYEQMPESIQAHLRYPEGLFNIQASMYQSYHMQDVRVFYNKEDLWTIPKEVYAGAEQLVEPYYVVIRLPDESREEFLIMLPFTPVNKNNTIGWLAARCDGEHYGKLLAYYFPKEKLVYGPSQIENRIQQDTTITEQLALWSRGGSRVIRGNLLFIPVGKSNLYVEPVFLQAEAGGLPELKRVIVAAGDKIVMRPTLDESISAVFGTELQPATPVIQPPTQPPDVEKPELPQSKDINTLIEEANQHYSAAQQYLKSSDWTGYGREMDLLREVLEKLAELAAE